MTADGSGTGAWAGFVWGLRRDLRLSVRGLPVKGYASHGESWSVALSLRLASAETVQDLAADHPLTPRRMCEGASDFTALRFRQIERECGGVGDGKG